MKTAVSLTLNFDPGNSIEDAFDDAAELANKIGCVMEFEFNGVHCIAYPGNNPRTGVERYYKAVKSDVKYKIAVTRW